MPRPRRQIVPVLLALALVASGGAVAHGQVDALFGAPPARRKPIVLGLPTPTEDKSGKLLVEPNVTVGVAPAAVDKPQFGDNWGDATPQAAPRGPVTLAAGASDGAVNPATLKVLPAFQPLAPPPAGPPMPVAAPSAAGSVPLPPPPSAAPPAGAATPLPLGAPTEELPLAAPPPATIVPKVEPMFAQSLCVPGPAPHGHQHKGTFYGLGGVEAGTGDPGIGHERVMFAPFAIDITQPETDLQFRVDAFYHRYNPDRLEYFWAREGSRGPKLPEIATDSQDIRAAWEVAAGKAFSITTEIPIEAVNPELNLNTAGLGDMSVTTKTLLLDGNQWQITQIFRTVIPTGAPKKGLGTGHTSLEPGVLFRYKWSPETYLHGQVEYWFPLGGDPIYDGTILHYGFGVSHLLYESDTFAVIPTLEFVGYTLLNGAQTPIPPGVGPQPIDTMGIFEVHPGVRFVRDTLGDLGTYEWGISSGFGITQNKWYNAMLLVEIRFVY